MRLLLVPAAALLFVVLGAVPASADPLICVITGAVHVGDISYDPPDPCLL